VAGRLPLAAAAGGIEDAQGAARGQLGGQDRGAMAADRHRCSACRVPPIEAVPDLTLHHYTPPSRCLPVSGIAPARVDAKVYARQPARMYA